MEIILELKNVNVSYDGKQALSNINMKLPKNKITCIIGPSGCGKTTLLKSLNRMIEQEIEASFTGDVLFEGQNTRTMSEEVLRRKIGLVYQTPTPFPFSIYKNMAYAPTYYGVKDKTKLDALIVEKLKQANLYEEVKDDLGKNATKLSGGQQQRLCIARALTVDPTVLLLDEPCSSLDVKSTEKIEQLLLGLKEKYTIVVVTHNIFQAKRISDYTAFMYEAELLEFAITDALFSSPQHKKTQAFIAGLYG